MVLTSSGCYVKYIAMLDEGRQLATAVGPRGQTHTFPISQLKTDRGIAELRDLHQRYKDKLAADVAKDEAKQCSNKLRD